MKTYKVNIDGVLTIIKENEFQKYNVIVNKSNGYSHDFSVIEKFNKNIHFKTIFCPLFNRNFSYVPTHLTIKNPIGFIPNTSTTTFS